MKFLAATMALMAAALFPSSTKLITMTTTSDKNHGRNEDEDSTKTSTHRATLITKTVIDLIDPRYNDEAYTTTMVDLCHMTKYDLGFPYGMFADRFSQLQYLWWRTIQFI
jgi:hypothetical protein